MSLMDTIRSVFSSTPKDPTAYNGRIEPKGNGYEIFSTSVSSSGEVVTPTTALRVAAVYACVRLLAGGLSMLPFHIYKNTPNGRSRIEGSEFERFLNVEPTEMYSAAAHWEGVMADILLRGDAFTYIRRSPTGKVLDLIPLPWSSVSIQKDESTYPNRLKYFVSYGGRTFGCEASDMLHFPGFGFDGVRSMSVIQYAANAATGNALSMDKYSGSFFKKGANPSIVLSTDKTMSEDLVDHLRKDFVERYSGPDNMNALPLVLTEGLKAEKLTISASDAQLIEARQFQVVDIARAFGVPPHMIGETSAATSWGSGIESMNRAFVTWSLNPHLIRIEQEINRKLFTKGQFVEISRDALMVGDSKAQADYLRAMLGGPGTGPGILTVDEVRKMKNFKPLGGKASELYDPRIVEKANENSQSSDKKSDKA